MKGYGGMGEREEGTYEVPYINMCKGFFSPIEMKNKIKVPKVATAVPQKKHHEPPNQSFMK